MKIFQPTREDYGVQNFIIFVDLTQIARLVNLIQFFDCDVPRVPVEHNRLLMSRCIEFTQRTSNDKKTRQKEN